MDLDIVLHVDRAEQRLTVDTRTTLLDALRERLGITSPNAVHHATGTRVRDLPITLDKLLEGEPP